MIPKPNYLPGIGPGNLPRRRVKKSWIITYFIIIFPLGFRPIGLRPIFGMRCLLLSDGFMICVLVNWRPSLGWTPASFPYFFYNTPFRLISISLTSDALSPSYVILFILTHTLHYAWAIHLAFLICYPVFLPSNFLLLCRTTSVHSPTFAPPTQLLLIVFLQR